MWLIYNSGSKIVVLLAEMLQALGQSPRAKVGPTANDHSCRFAALWESITRTLRDFRLITSCGSSLGLIVRSKAADGARALSSGG